MNPNDPMSQFRERYQQYVETKAPSSPPVMNASGGKGFFNKFYVQGLIVGVVIIGSGVLVYLNFKPSTQNNVAANPTPKPIAQVTQAPKKIEITEDQIDAEMQRIWGTYYTEVKDNSEYRNEAKKKIQNEILVSNAVKTYAIALTNEDVTNKKTSMFGSNSRIASTDNSSNPLVKDILIRQELEKKVATWRIIDMAASFKAQDSSFESEKKKALDSLDKIRTLLQSGKTMKEAYDEAKTSPDFDKGLTIEENVYVTKGMDWSPNFSNAIFGANKGDITHVTSAVDSFMVAKITDGNNGQYNSYDDWLAAQTK